LENLAGGLHTLIICSVAGGCLVETGKLDLMLIQALLMVAF
jgi:hypothetical protein